MEKSTDFHAKAIALIREQMAEKHVNSPLLAKKLGLSPATVFRMIENGRTMSIERLHELSEVLNYNFFRALAGELAMPEPAGEEFPGKKRLEELEIENRLLMKLLRPGGS
jgi:transcriptional regulator with XRE-family HTH domain